MHAHCPGSFGGGGCGRVARCGGGCSRRCRRIAAAVTSCRHRRESFAGIALGRRRRGGGGGDDEVVRGLPVPDDCVDARVGGPYRDVVVPRGRDLVAHAHLHCAGRWSHSETADYVGGCRHGLGAAWVCNRVLVPQRSLRGRNTACTACRGETSGALDRKSQHGALAALLHGDHRGAGWAVTIVIGRAEYHTV